MIRYRTLLSTIVFTSCLVHLDAAMEPLPVITSMMDLPNEKSPLEDMREQLHLNDFDESDLDMITHIGCCYLNGWGLQHDNEKAYEYFVFAAKEGYALAQYYLGCCCNAGIGILNPFVAFDCFRRAARQGHTEAQSNLADCFFYGRGTEQDNKQALHWYLQAASHNDLHAQRMLTQCFAQEISYREYLPLTAPWSLLAAMHEAAIAAPRLIQQPIAMQIDDVELADTVFAQAMEE